MTTRPTLVVLTTHFGTNFSGGSTATCEILSRLEHEFSAIHVIASELGEHPFQQLRWHRYSGATDPWRLLGQFDPQKTVFYADFYNAFWLALRRFPFVFTYHDNWPELAAMSFRFRCQGLFYRPLYHWIFRRAQHVIVVSNRKKQQLQQKCRKLSLIRNGCASAPQPLPQHPREGVLMVGNIDSRKYVKAVELFRRLPEDFATPIDIYGHTNDPALVAALREFRFVNLKGYCPTIPYHRYRLLLHTSLMENLSMAWCESLLQKTPVVTFDVGAASEVITPTTGICVEPLDVPSLEKALLGILATPMRILEIPAHLAEYNWNSAADSYAKILLDRPTDCESVRTESDSA